ncbi:MAG TPA: sulfatase-like hydrolase/transferase [Bryobacteraceae bacterium]|nr:sulfatase-like hydrolase/transferase [Bryobacteraceae bacterium]
MRSRVYVCVLALSALAACKRSETNAQQTPHLLPLNLVVVTIDTLRPDHLHCYGYAKIETPNIDGIAQRGTLFENAVTQTPLTPPSHASIFTGLNPPTHHVRNTGGFVLPSPSTTLATILQQQGWDTAAFISSAVLKKFFGLNQGFAVYDDQMPKPGKGHEFIEDAERHAGQTVDRAIQWLGAQSGKPYLLWVHVYDPHAPYQPPSPYKEQYRDRPYDGEIAYTDHELGRLFEAIRKKSPADKTLIAVLSDHGESLGEHGEYTHGVFLYDSTLRIAFLVAGPGVPSGLRVKQQARTIDFLPTILDLMGGRAPATVQGTSLTPYFHGKDAPTAVSYAETLYPKINMGWAELRGIRTNHWKYIRAPKPELYDLSQDAGETSNVIESHAAEVQRFESQLRAVIGTGGTEKVESALVDRKTLDQLQSLGYTSGFSAKSYDLTGQGADPKDRVGILKLMQEAEHPLTPVRAGQSIGLLRQALNEDKANPILYYVLGANLEKAGRYGEAMKLYETAVHNGIESARLHSRLGDLLVRSGKKDEAIPEYEKAAQLNPADAESQANLATAYLEKGRLADAERVYKWVITTDPAYATAYNGLGVVAIQRQDAATARGYFEKAVALDADLVEAQLNLGIIYKDAGDRARARACFQAFLAKASPAQYGEVIPKVREELAAMP